MTLPYPSSPDKAENIGDSISRIEQNLEYLDGNIGLIAFKQVVSTSIEMSTARASSTVNVAGVGFTPTGLMVWANEETGKSFSFGAATSNTLEGCSFVKYNSSVGVDSTLLYYLEQAAGASMEAVLQGFHSDGAYLELTRTGAPVGAVMNINYIFIR